MSSKFIPFKKERELGEIISDSFRFLKENYKKLFTYIFKLTWPALLVLVLSLGMYLYSTVGMFSISSLTNPNGTTLFTGPKSGLIIMSLLFLLLSVGIFMTLLNGTVLHYVKSYVRNQGDVVWEEVQHGVTSDFWKLLGAIIIAYIMIVVGILFCIIPGIYLYVPLSLVLTIVVFDELNAIDAISQSFRLVKDNWWITFATLLVMGIIVYVCSLVFSIPIIIYSMVSIISSAQEVSASDPSSAFGWVFIALSIIARIGQFLLYTVTVISAAFIYYNLNEKKNDAGRIEQIDNLGNKA